MRAPAPFRQSSRVEIPVWETIYMGVELVAWIGFYPAGTLVAPSPLVKNEHFQFQIGSEFLDKRKPTLDTCTTKTKGLFIHLHICLFILTDGSLHSTLSSHFRPSPW